MTLQVGVKIFLRNPESKYLLMRRSSGKYPGVKGKWDIPGGRINPGSLLLENLAREVMEETQLEIISHPRFIYAQDIIPNEERHIVRLTYVGDAKGEPVLDTNEDVDIYAKEIIDGGYLN